jgi:hypothetical protein
MKLFAILIAILGVALGFLYTNNPMLFGQRTGDSHDGITIHKHSPYLDDELFGLAGDIGSEFQAYRNHCLRVLTFTKYFLPEWVEKELPEAMELAAMAIAYHKVALWTDKALDYLDPSAAQLETALTGKVTDKEMAIMKEIILQHHKVTDFSSETLGKAGDALVNAVRKADWTDFTFGIVRFGMPAAVVEAAYDGIAGAGFHKMLTRLVPRLSPDSLVGQLACFKIFKW